MTHTSGPWKLETRKQREGAAGICVYVREWDNQVAYIPVREDKIHLANARLIAAAPDLLEAAKEAIDLYEYTAQSDDLSESGYKTYDKLVKAIAKAQTQVVR